MKHKILLLVLIFCFTSCIQIIEDITINNDGSGRVKYTINASESKSRIDAVMLLDSVKNFKVPTLNEFRIQLNKLKSELVSIEGVKSVNYVFDETQFKISFTIDFTNVEVLTGIQNKLIKENEQKIEYSFSNKSFKKEVNVLSQNINIKEVEDIGSANFIGIVRFDKEIENVSNSNSKISGNHKAVMTKISLSELLSNPQLINNQILIK